MANRTNRPSVFVGLKTATRLWALVFAVWIIGLAVMTPAVMIFEGAAESVLGRVPEAFEPPEGDFQIMILRSLGEVKEPLVLVVFAGVVLTWAWTVLWHAGVARFVVWDGDAPVSIARILGYGLGAWWRYCRLSLTALAVLLGLFVAIWVLVAAGVGGAFSDMAEGRMVVFIAAGLVCAGVAKLLMWVATLRGCWELAKPTSRSAVLALLRGMKGVLRQPLATFGVVLALGVPEMVLAAVPVVAPLIWPELRGTGAGDALGLISALLTAFFSVALFAAFSPVSGLNGSSAED